MAIRKKEVRALIVLIDCLLASGGVWVARHLQDPELQVRFVPARNALGAGSFPDLNATDIRAIIRKVPPARQVQALIGSALKPQILSEQVQEREERKALNKKAKRQTQSLSRCRCLYIY